MLWRQYYAGLHLLISSNLVFLSLHPAHDHADNHPVYTVMTAITAAHVTHIALPRILPPMRAAALPALHNFRDGVLLWLSAHYYHLFRSTRGLRDALRLALMSPARIDDASCMRNHDPSAIAIFSVSR